MLSVFVWTDAVSAQILLPRAGVLSENWVEQFDLSSQMGLVQTAHQYGNPSLVLISDSHANIAAQQKIVSILNEVERQSNKPLLIALEGAQGPVSPVLINAIPNEQDKQQVADHYLKEARLSAGEYFSLFSENKTLLYGVESKKLYEKNREAYLQAKEKAKVLLPQLDKEWKRLDQKRAKLFSKNHYQFVLKKEAFHKGTLSFISYAPFLSDTFRHDLKQSLPSLFEQAWRVEQLAAQVHATSLKKEVSSLLKSAQKDVELFSKLLRSQIAFQKGLTTPLEYYLSLSESVSDLNKFPHLKQYIALLKDHEQVSPLELDKVLNQMEETIEQRFSSSEAVRALLFETKVSQITQKMVQLECSRKELRFYWEHQASFSKERLDWAKQFYGLALKRDKELLKNTLSLMKDKPNYQVVLISGGFHAEGLIQNLKKQKQSHLLLTPQFNMAPDQALYLKRLNESQGNRLAIATLFELNNSLPINQQFSAEIYSLTFVSIVASWIQKNAQPLAQSTVFPNEVDELMATIEDYFGEMAGKAKTEFATLVLRWQSEVPQVGAARFEDVFAPVRAEVVTHLKNNRYNFILHLGQDQYVISIGKESVPYTEGTTTFAGLNVSIAPALGSGIVKTPVTLPEQKKGFFSRLKKYSNRPDGVARSFSEMLEFLKTRDPDIADRFEGAYVGAEKRLKERFPWFADIELGEGDPAPLRFIETDGESRFAYINRDTLEIVFDTSLLESTGLAQIELFEELFHFMMEWDRDNNDQSWFSSPDEDLAFEEVLTDFEKIRFYHKALLGDDREDLFKTLEKEGVDLYDFRKLLINSIPFWSKIGSDKPVDPKKLKKFVDKLLAYAGKESENEAPTSYTGRQRSVLQKEGTTGFLRYLFFWHHRYLVRVNGHDNLKTSGTTILSEAAYSRKILRALLLYHFEEEALFELDELVDLFAEKNFSFKQSYLDLLPVEERKQVFWRLESRVNPTSQPGDVALWLQGLSLYEQLEMLSVFPEETLEKISDKELKRFIPTIIKARTGKDKVGSLRAYILYKRDEPLSLEATLSLLKESPFSKEFKISNKVKPKYLEFKDDVETLFVSESSSDFMNSFITDELIQRLKDRTVRLVFLGDSMNGSVIKKKSTGAAYKEGSDLPEGVETYLGLDLVDREDKTTKTVYLDQRLLYQILKLQLLFPSQVFVLRGNKEMAGFMDSKHKNLSSAALPEFIEMAKKGVPRDQKSKLLARFFSRLPFAVRLISAASSERGVVAAPRIGPDKARFVFSPSGLGASLTDITERLKEQRLVALTDLKPDQEGLLKRIRSDRRDTQWSEQTLLLPDRDEPLTENGVTITPEHKAKGGIVYHVEIVAPAVELPKPEPIPAPSLEPAAAPVQQEPVAVAQLEFVPPAVLEPASTPQTISAFTVIGDYHRDQGGVNEDTVFVEELSDGIQYTGLFDGMGGVANGAAASKIARDQFQAVAPFFSLEMIDGQVLALLREAFYAAQKQIDEELSAGGTTLTVAVSIPDPKKREARVFVLSIADSRAYLYNPKSRKNQLQFLTLDNLLPKKEETEKVFTLKEVKASLKGDGNNSQKILSEVDTAEVIEEAGVGWLFKFRNTVNNAMTVFNPKEPYHRSKPIFTVTSAPAGSTLFLSSDGIHDPLTHAEIEAGIATGSLEFVLQQAQARQQDADHVRRKLPDDDKTGVSFKVAPHLVVSDRSWVPSWVPYFGSTPTAEPATSQPFLLLPTEEPVLSEPVSAESEAFVEPVIAETIAPAEASPLPDAVADKPVDQAPLLEAIADPPPTVSASTSDSNTDLQEIIARRQRKNETAPDHGRTRTLERDFAKRFRAAEEDAVRLQDQFEPEDVLDLTSSLSVVTHKIILLEYQEALTLAQKIYSTLSEQNPEYEGLGLLIRDLEDFLNDDVTSASTILVKWEAFAGTFDLEALQKKFLDDKEKGRVSRQEVQELGEFVELLSNLTEKKKAPYKDFYIMLRSTLYLALRHYLPKTVPQIDRLGKGIEKIEVETELHEVEKRVKGLTAWIEKHARLTKGESNELTLQANYLSFLNKLKIKIDERKAWFQWQKKKATLVSGIKYSEAILVRNSFYELRSRAYPWIEQEEQELSGVWSGLFENVVKQSSDLESDLTFLKKRLSEKIAEASGAPLLMWLEEEGLLDEYGSLMSALSQVLGNQSHPKVKPEDKFDAETEKRLVSLAHEIDPLLLTALLGRFESALQDVLKEQTLTFSSQEGDSTEKNLKELINEVAEMDRLFFDENVPEADRISYAKWEHHVSLIWNKIYDEWTQTHEDGLARGEKLIDLAAIIHDNSVAFSGLTLDELDAEQEQDVLEKLMKALFNIVPFMIDREFGRFGIQNGMAGVRRKEFGFSRVITGYLYYALLKSSKPSTENIRDPELNFTAFSIPHILSQIPEGYKYYRSLLDYETEVTSLGVLRVRLGRPSKEARIQQIIKQMEEVQEAYLEETGDVAFHQKTLATTSFFDFVWEPVLTATRFQHIVDELTPAIEPDQVKVLREKVAALKREYREAAETYGVTVSLTQEELEQKRVWLEAQYEDKKAISEDFIQARLANIQSKGKRKQFPQARLDYFDLVLSQQTQGNWSQYSDELNSLFDQEATAETVEEKARLILRGLSGKGKMHQDTGRLSRLKLEVTTLSSDSDASFDDAFDSLTMNQEQDLEEKVSLFDWKILLLLQQLSKLDEIQDYSKRAERFVELRREFIELYDRAQLAESLYEKEVLNSYPSKKFEAKFAAIMDEWDVNASEVTFIDKRAEVDALIKKEREKGRKELADDATEAQIAAKAVRELGFLDVPEMEAYFLEFEQRISAKHKERTQKRKIEPLVGQLLSLVQSRLNGDPNSPTLLDDFSLPYIDLAEDPFEPNWDWDEETLFKDVLNQSLTEDVSREVLLELKLILLEFEPISETVLGEQIAILSEMMIVKRELKLREGIQTQISVPLVAAVESYVQDNSRGEMTEREGLIVEQKNLLNYLVYTYEARYERRMEITGEVRRIRALQKKLDQRELLVPLDFFTIRNAFDEFSGQLANELGQKGLFLNQLELFRSGINLLQEDGQSIASIYEFLTSVVPKLVRKRHLDSSTMGIMKQISTHYTEFLALKKAHELLLYFQEHQTIEGSLFEAADVSRAKTLVSWVIQANNRDGIRSPVDIDSPLFGQLSEQERLLTQAAPDDGSLSLGVVSLPEPTLDLNMDVLWVPTQLDQIELLQWTSVLAQSDLDDSLDLEAVSAKNGLRQSFQLQDKDWVQAQEVLFRIQYQFLYQDADFLDHFLLHLEWSKIQFLITRYFPDTRFPYVDSVEKLLNDSRNDRDMVLTAMKVALQQLKSALSRKDDEAWEQYRQTGTNEYLKEMFRFESRLNQVKKSIVPPQDWKDWVPQERFSEFLKEVVEQLDQLVQDPDQVNQVTSILGSSLDFFVSEEATQWGRIREKWGQFMVVWDSDPEHGMNYLLNIDWKEYQARVALIPYAIELELEMRQTQRNYQSLVPSPEWNVIFDSDLEEILRDAFDGSAQIADVTTDFARLLSEKEEASLIWIPLSKWAQLSAYQKDLANYVVVADSVSPLRLRQYLDRNWEHPAVRQLQVFSIAPKVLFIVDKNSPDAETNLPLIPLVDPFDHAI